MRRDVTVSGEFTISCRVLSVSGISEKVLAAQRAGVKTIIFPESKKVDVEDLESDVTEGVELIHAGVISTISDRVLI